MMPSQQMPAVEAGNRFVGPRDSLERALRNIWVALLGHRNFGVNDSFFDVGGNSLMVLQLQESISSEFGYRIELTELFQASTISATALLLRGDAAAGKKSLVPIQPRGAKPPLFCFHPLGGSTAIYFTLARALGPDQPVYGLQAVGLLDGHAAQDSIPEMAAGYVEEILTVQPSGPYQLLGFSLGGLLAYEAANALRGHGAPPFVVLIHTYSSYPAERRPDEVYRALGSFAMNLPFQRDEFDGLQEAEALELIRNRAIKCGMFREDFPVRRLRRILRTVDGNLRAARAYTPQPYSGPVLLLTAEDEAAGAESSDLGWSRYAKSLTIRTIGVNHGFLLEEKGARRIAAALWSA